MSSQLGRRIHRDQPGEVSLETRLIEVHALRKWTAVVAVLAGICGSSALGHAQNSDKIDLAEITKRLTQWRGSYVNLRMVYELRSLSTTIKDPVTGTEKLVQNDPITAPTFGRTEWIWADHGLNLLDVRSFHAGALHTVDVFNGPKGVAFRARYKQPSEGKELLEDLQIRGLGVGKPISSTERVAMRGLYWPALAKWLPELLSEWKWTVEEIEEVDGEWCARIGAADPRHTDVAWTHILWLDLNHDCLVRRHLMPSIPDRRLEWDFLVDEFQQLENGLWFPKRGRFQVGVSENQLWEVTEVVVNQSLDLSRFDPPTPDIGTVVDDGKGMARRHGGASMANSSGLLPNTIGDSTPQKLPSPSGTPPTFGWIWWSGSLICVSLALLATGFWLSHRK